MAERGALSRAYHAAYGRLFARMYDAMLAKEEREWLADKRADLLAAASGPTLELGAGTGLNLEHYPDAVTELTLTEPFGPMADRLRERVAALGRAARIVEAPAERLPFDDDSFETVVSTLVLCTVDDQSATLREIARVLRPGGMLLFFEHVYSDSPRLARWQDRLHGPWYAIGHGCHCNRDTLAAITDSPLRVERVEKADLMTPPIVKPTIEGAATAPA